jgi:hypothetical protein
MNVLWNLVTRLMAYTDFTLEAAEAAFGFTAQPDALFPGLKPLSVPPWLQESLDRGRQTAALVSEKARSEFLIAPILLAVRDVAPGELTIYSGQCLDVDPERGLVGECDYILARTAPVPRLRAPLVTVLEAKKGDVEAGLGQCAAQMVGARLFNERAGEPAGPVFGCVTTGELWQFLRLEGPALKIDKSRLFLDNVGGILAVLQAVVSLGAAKVS